jgi:hypothetical protein
MFDGLLAAVRIKYMQIRIQLLQNYIYTIYARQIF